MLNFYDDVFFNSSSSRRSAANATAANGYDGEMLHQAELRRPSPASPLALAAAKIRALQAELAAARQAVCGGNATVPS